MSGLQLHLPEVLVLLLPAAVLWWLVARHGRARWLRALVLLLVVLAAAGPELVDWRGGSDVVLVLDRSRSLPDAELLAQQELVELAGARRRGGDRLGVIATADGQLVLQVPSAEGLPRVADAALPDGASDLRRGLELAAGVIPQGRTGRVVLHSDGQATGLDPRAVAAQLALRGIPLDVLPVRVPELGDAAILQVELPEELRLGESFIAAFTVLGDTAERRSWTVRRSGDTVVASGEVELVPGRPVAVSFADRPTAAGLARYEVELGLERPGSEPGVVADRNPLNNLARAGLRVVGGERILLMGGDGSPGNVARALRAAGLAVDCVPEGPLDLGRLLAYRALVLEQVPADRLGAHGLHAVAEWVEHLGGGLVMLGGRRSFGSGGYHRSAVEEVLPVTMELRDEHRKLSVAMAIALDRSGSMGVQVPDGRTKMDLANEGAVSVIDLLSPMDAVAVFAVDSAPHQIVPLTRVADVGALIEQVRGIESMGGGIYVYEALVAAGKELLAANQGTRHLVLFADAADAEQPGDYVDLLADYTRQGITVSVIGMGSEADSDADFLKDVAARGGGRISFAAAPEDLPRLFAQETVLVARSAWVDEPVALAAEPSLATVVGQGEVFAGDWPVVPGYNLVYPRDRAAVLVQAPGDPEAPAVASWFIGTGRSVAVTIDCDAVDDAGLLAWRGYAPLLAGLVRWSTGGESRQGDAVLSAQRAGRSVVLRLELDPASRADWPVATPELVLVADRADQAEQHLAMQPVDEGVYEAIAELGDTGALLPAAILDTPGGRRSVLGPALQLPYPPEAEPRLFQRPGGEVLEELARLSGGTVLDDLNQVFANPPSPGRVLALAPWLVALVLLILLAEIIVRRMGLALPELRRRKARTVERAPPSAPPPPPPPASGDAGQGLGRDQGLHEALRQLRRRR